MRLRVLIVILFVLALLSPSPLRAQTPRHRVVVEVVTVLSDGWAFALSNVETLQREFGPSNIEIEVVVHGPALSMLHKTDTDFAARIQRLSEHGVRFVASRRTMRDKRLTSADMFPFVSLVDSGVGEIVRKQEAGWTYIKSGY